MRKPSVISNMDMLSDSFLTSNTVEGLKLKTELKAHEKVTEVDGPTLKDMLLFAWVPKLRAVITDDFYSKVKLPSPLRRETIERMKS